MLSTPARPEAGAKESSAAAGMAPQRVVAWNAALIASNLHLLALLDQHRRALDTLEAFVETVSHAILAGRRPGPADPSRAPSRQLLATLTARQREVLALVIAGHPSKRIATALGISQRTVENHRASIMVRTGSKSLPALAQLALLGGFDAASVLARIATRGGLAASPALTLLRS